MDDHFGRPLSRVEIAFADVAKDLCHLAQGAAFVMRMPDNLGRTLIANRRDRLTDFTVRLLILFCERFETDNFVRDFGNILNRLA